MGLSTKLSKGGSSPWGTLSLPSPSSQPARWHSPAIILLAWLILQLGGLFTPPLLDDVDSVYIEVAREMIHRNDYVTPYIDGIRFFDKPPLMYWLAAGSMRLFGEHDWAARLPLALAFLALLFAIYALGRRFYGTSEDPNRGALYAALIFATALGPWLYTRFFIPDLLICLWMTLGAHFFLTALSRAAAQARLPQVSLLRPGSGSQPSVAHSSQSHRDEWFPPSSPLIPSLLFAATLALNLLTKGFIGLVFPLAFVLLYLVIIRQLKLLLKLHLLKSLAVFLAIALPWHILAALRNPAIPMPPGLGLPARAGWAWFYLYNEHIARFLGRRIPHDYGQTPIWLFWLYAILWMFPWCVFLPAAIARAFRHLGHKYDVTIRQREAALTVTIWSLTVLIFFTLSSRQEYYSLPALPALALLLGGTLSQPAQTEPQPENREQRTETKTPLPSILQLHRLLLLPLSLLIATTCLFLALTAPKPDPTTDLSTLLSQNPTLYNLSLGHIFDLTGAAMAFFRGPLLAVAAGMLLLGLASYHFRRRHLDYPANLTLAAGMVIVLLAAHTGYARFNPILGSQPLAQSILTEEALHPEPANQILLDGELTSGSTLLFYTRQPVHLVNGRVNGPWFGSFWPDAPQIFEDERTLRQLWAGSTRVFLLTYTPASRIHDLTPYAPVHTLATAGGKTILTNR